MATERVGIEIDLMGYDEAYGQMLNLDRMMKGLSGRKNYLKVKAEVEQLKMNREALKAHKVKIQADITDVDKKINKIKARIRELSGQLKLYKKGSPAFNRIVTQIGRLRNELAGLQGLRTNLGAEFKQTNAEINQTISAIQRLQHALNNAKMSSKSLGQIFKGISSATSHLGGALQSAGNALTRMNAPLRMLTSGVLMGAGYKALGTVEEGLSSGFKRYDIMKKYPKMMAEYSKGSYTAEKSIQDLNKAVLGLPTGLDEIVEMSQRYTLSLGDMKKGTDLAIASNNAFLASMTTESQKYQGMLQLQDLMNGKKLTSREWMSLGTSMGKAINEIGKELGYGSDEMGKFRDELYSGKIATKDFLNALIKVGTGSGKVAKMAEYSKETWEAFSVNVKTAFSRMMVGVIESLDEITQAVTGKNLNTLLSETIPSGIDKMTASVKDWIKANPDKILGFFDTLKSIDWRGLGKGIVEGFGQMLDIIQKMAGIMGGKDMSGIGKLIPWIGTIGTSLTIVGGLVRGLRYPLAAIGTAVVGLARAIGGGFIGSAIIKNIPKLGKVLGGIGAAGKAAGKAAKGAKGFSIFSKAVGGGAKFGSIFKGFLPALEVIGGVGAFTTAITGVAALDTTLLSKAVSNVVDITGNISKVFDNVNKIKDSTFDADALRESVNGIFSMYDIIYGEKTGSRTRAANKAMPGRQERKSGLAGMKKGALKNISDSIGHMRDIFSIMGQINSQMTGLKDFKGFDESAVQAINRFSQDLGSIYNEMDISFRANVNPKTAKNFNDVIAQSKTMFSSLSEVVGLLPSLQASVKGIMARGGGTGMGYSIMDMLKQTLTGENGLFATIGAIYESIDNNLLGGAYNKSGNIKDAESFAEVMANVKSMFTSLNGVVSLLPQLQTSLGPLTQRGGGGKGKSAIYQIGEQVSQLFTQLGKIYSEFDVNMGIFNAKDIATKMSQVASAVDSIKSIVGKLNSLGGGALSGGGAAVFTAVDQIKSMLTKLGEALNTGAIDQIKAQVDQFKATIDNLISSLNSDFSNVKVEVHIDGTVTGVNELISKVNQAKSRIRSAVRSIPNSFTRHVYIHIQPHVNVGSVNVPKIPGAHTGGYIGGFGKPQYRSKGGGIGNIFKPKGTDTVPAMLTPGEYVMKKKAVDGFGVRFMQKINNLDVAGAMRELSAKASSMSSVVNRGTTIYNNVTNNSNPTINQNINTNNPNFAFKRSNRYVMAL